MLILTKIKRIIPVIVIIATAVFQGFSRQPATGYRGFAEIGWSTFHSDDILWPHNESHWGVSTVHGYQINPMIFVGAGLEIGYNAWAETWYIPVFADVRGDFKFGMFTPFADMRIGWTPTSDGGFRFNPSIGYRFNWGRKAGINVSIGLLLQNHRYTEADFYYDWETGEYVVQGPVRTTTHTAFAPELRLGFDF